MFVRVCAHIKNLPVSYFVACVAICFRYVETVKCLFIHLFYIKYIFKIKCGLDTKTKVSSIKMFEVLKTLKYKCIEFEEMLLFSLFRNMFKCITIKVAADTFGIRF